MTTQEFEEFEISLSQQLFHVMSDDVDDETDAKLEEVILVQMLAGNPGALKHKPLKQWVEETVGKCYSADVLKNNQEVIQKQKERPYWKEYENFMKKITDTYANMLMEDSSIPIDEQDVPDYKIINGEVTFNVTFNSEGIITCQIYDRCPNKMDGVIKTPEHVIKEWRRLKNASAIIWLNKNALTYEKFIEEYVTKSCRTCSFNHGTCWNNCHDCKDMDKYQFNNILEKYKSL